VPGQGHLGTLAPRASLSSPLSCPGEGEQGVAVLLPLAGPGACRRSSRSLSCNAWTSPPRRTSPSSPIP
jgi:hypothetical protein